MQLPVMPPVAPMLAKAVHELPVGAQWYYEPKWDGFRSLVFKDGDELELTSRNERSLTRYFPELVAVLRLELPERCVLDGEIVIMDAAGRLDFDALLARIHPAGSRVAKLAQATPASYVAFDLLALGETDWSDEAFAARRGALEDIAAGRRGALACTPVSRDPAQAAEWFVRFEGGGLDGVVAKRADLPYRPDERVMAKWKHERTADCVVAGLRRDERGGVASLLLGLYDAQGVLHHVGVASSFSRARRDELADRLAPLGLGEDEQHPWLGAQSRGRRPGGESRWSRTRDGAFEPLRPELVAEVAYDHLQGDRFRHATQLRRVREDRAARSCNYAQLEVVPPAELSELLGRPGAAR